MISCSDNSDNDKNKTDAQINSSNDLNINTCSCDITYNGEEKTIDCGEETCIQNILFKCSSTAQISQEGSCNNEVTNDTGSLKDSGPSDSSGNSDQAPYEPTCDKLKNEVCDKCPSTYKDSCLEAATKGETYCISWYANIGGKWCK
jgi:hypothetical protein